METFYSDIENLRAPTASKYLKKPLKSFFKQIHSCISIKYRYLTPVFNQIKTKNLTHEVAHILKATTGSKILMLFSLILAPIHPPSAATHRPQPSPSPSWCCHSDAHLSQTSNSFDHGGSLRLPSAQTPLQTRVLTVSPGRAAAGRCALGPRLGAGKVT